MQPIPIEALARILGATVTGRPGETRAGASAPQITGISTDSRTIRPGDCFFAIAGENFDGHDYVAEVLRKGAACAVVSREVDGATGLLLRVPDTIQALGDLARAYRRMNPFKVVAITGSVGKTTTRQIVHHVLSRRFRTHQAQKSFNNNIGLPLTLLGARPQDEVIIAELGANHPGEIAGLTRIAQPDIAVVTNAHPAHLEGFGDLATIIREKLSIADGLSNGGVFIVNGDIEPLVAAARERGRPFRTFGRSPGARYRAQQIVCSGTDSTFTIQGRQVRLPLPGPGNVENALAAWAVCDQFGLSVDDFARAVESLPAVSMRAETLQIGDDDGAQRLLQRESRIDEERAGDASQSSLVLRFESGPPAGVHLRPYGRAGPADADAARGTRDGRGRGGGRSARRGRRGPEDHRPGREGDLATQFADDVLCRYPLRL